MLQKFSSVAKPCFSRQKPKAPPGFEPGYNGFAIRCLSRLATAPEYTMKMAYVPCVRFGNYLTKLKGHMVQSC